MSLVHQAKRPPFKRYVTDPLEGLVVGFICLVLWALPLSRVLEHLFIMWRASVITLPLKICQLDCPIKQMQKKRLF